MGVEGIVSSAKINEGSKSIYSNNLISIKDLQQIKSNINEIRAETLRIVFERDRSKLDEQINNFNDLTNEDLKLQNEYESLYSTPEAKKNYDDFKNDLVKYRDVRNKVIEIVKADNYEEAAKIYNLGMNVIRTSMFEKLKKCVEINAKSAEQANLNNINEFNNASNTIMIYTAIAF